MIVDKDLIAPLTTGELQELRRDSEPREQVGHSYVVQSRVGGVKICRVRITAREQDDEGWLLRFELERQEPPRWLPSAPGRGYVRGMARNDGRPPPGALHGEPEAVSELDQRRISAEARGRFSTFKFRALDEALADAGTPARQVGVLEDAALLAGVDARSVKRGVRLIRMSIERGYDPTGPLLSLERKIRERWAA